MHMNDKPSQSPLVSISSHTHFLIQSIYKMHSLCMSERTKKEKEGWSWSTLTHQKYAVWDERKYSLIFTFCEASVKNKTMENIFDHTKEV